MSNCYYSCIQYPRNMSLRLPIKSGNIGSEVIIIVFDSFSLISVFSL